MAQEQSNAELPDAASAVERVIHAVREGVHNGSFAPGQRLIEGDFTAALQVSRGPVREAFRRLSAEGVLVEEPYRGMSVRRISAEELRGIYRVREMLEGLAARLAAERVAAGASAADLKRIAAKLNQAIRKKAMQDYIDLNKDLHDAIVEIAQSSTVATLLAQLNFHVIRVRYRNLLNWDNAKSSNQGHAEIVAAIATGDGDAAEEAMRRHIRDSGTRIFADV